MHIPDGYLSPGVAGAMSALALVAVAGAAYTAARSPRRPAPQTMATVASLTFAAQMLNFPIDHGTSGHFMGGLLACILLGPSVGLLVMSLVLAVQCLVFADGGITALGANVVNMGLVGGIVAGGIFKLLRGILPQSRTALVSCAGASAWAAIVLAALACSAQLAMSGAAPLGVVAPPMLGVHALIGLGEAVITMIVISVVAAAAPDLILQGADEAEASHEQLQHLEENL